MKITTFLLTLFACVSAYAAESQSGDDIRVHLSTNNPLTPVYIGGFQGQNAGLERAYLTELESVLQFDMNYNGNTKVLPKSEAKEELLSQPNSYDAFNAEKWKNFGVAYVMRGAVVNKQLSVTIFSVQSGSVKQFKEIILSGNIGQDRRQIHKIADGIYTALFNKPGIANTRILYSAQTKGVMGAQWTSEIWECDWDGANSRQVTHEGSYCVTPVFIPSQGSQFANDKFLYVSYKKGQPKIYIASLKEGSGKRLVDLRGNQFLPAISPKKDKIAFICDAAGRTDLFIQFINGEKGEIGGKPVQLFSFPRATQASPTFSPDGSKIAFVSDKDGPAKVYIIPSTPSAKRATPFLISKQNAESSCPAWSPDGTKIAYSAKTSGTRQIWIYDFSTGEERQLTSGPGNKENPAWAPNSSHIVFNSTDGASSELFLVNLNQPEAVRITKGPGKKHYPTWGTR
jgi:TolB protein